MCAVVSCERTALFQLPWGYGGVAGPAGMQGGEQSVTLRKAPKQSHPSRPCHTVAQARSSFHIRGQKSVRHRLRKEILHFRLTTKEICQLVSFCKLICLYFCLFLDTAANEKIEDINGCPKSRSQMVSIIYNYDLLSSGCVILTIGEYVH